MTLSVSRVLRRPTAIFLNSSRLNYDNRLDYSRFHGLTNFICHDVDNMTDKDEILALVETHKPEIIITKEMEVPKDALNAFPSCVKLICEAGTGYNNIPISLAREKGIDVANVPTYSNESVAHMVITYIMAFSAQLFEQSRMLHNDDKSNFYVFQHPIYEVTNKTLGLIGGSGTIGTAVTDVAIPLGMNILISSRSGKLPPGHKYESHPKVKVVPIDEVFKNSDFLSINCPLNAETRHSIGEREIRLMKPTAYLINTARGAIIKESELIKCMKENVISGAGLDTQEVEPPPDDSEIWKLKNIFLTPHIGWRRLETRQRLVDMTADNIECYITGRKKNIVN